MQPRPSKHLVLLSDPEDKLFSLFYSVFLIFFSFYVLSIFVDFAQYQFTQSEFQFLLMRKNLQNIKRPYWLVGLWDYDAFIA